MNKKTSLIKCLAAAGLLAASAAPQAALVVFNTQASFLAAVSSPGVDTFIGLSITDATASPLLRGTNVPGPPSRSERNTPPSQPIHTARSVEVELGAGPFWQTAVDGHNAKDVGKRLGLSPGAVYVAKSRVLARLKEEISQLSELTQKADISLRYYRFIFKPEIENVAHQKYL